MSDRRWPEPRCLWCQRTEDTHQPPRHAIRDGFHDHCRVEARRTARTIGPLTYARMAQSWACSESTIWAIAQHAYRKMYIVCILDGKVCRVCDGWGCVGARRLRACPHCAGSGYFATDEAGDTIRGNSITREKFAAWHPTRRRKQSRVVAVGDGSPASPAALPMMRVS